jgi:SIT family siderophore-iron:H+ symporter-like MFS transporter
LQFGARHPVVPFRLLTNRTVIACLLISIFHPVAMGIAK